MKYLALLPLLAFATPVQADLLDGIIGDIKTKAKSEAFDAAIESQAPGLGGITDNLSDEQKAKLFDLGVENADTIAKVGETLGGSGGLLGGAATAGAIGTVLSGGGTQAAATPTYEPAGSVIGSTAPIYEPTTVPVYQSPAPVYDAGPAPAPVYENIGTITLD